MQPGAWLRGQGDRASNTNTNTRGVLVGGLHLQGPKQRCQLPLPHTHPGLIWGLAELAERVGLSPGPPVSNLDLLQRPHHPGPAGPAGASGLLSGLRRD